MTTTTDPLIKLKKKDAATAACPLLPIPKNLKKQILRLTGSSSHLARFGATPSSPRLSPCVPSSSWPKVGRRGGEESSGMGREAPAEGVTALDLATSSPDPVLGRPTRGERCGGGTDAAPPDLPGHAARGRGPCSMPAIGPGHWAERAYHCTQRMS